MSAIPALPAPRHWLVCFRVIFCACLAALSTSARAVQRIDIQRAIESEVNKLFDGKVDRKLYVVYSKVDAEEKAKAAPAKTKSRLPFAAVEIDTTLLDKLLHNLGGEESFGYEDLRFSIVVIFDKSVAEGTKKALEDAVRERFAINGAERRVDIKTSEIFTEKLVPADPRVAENTRQDAEKIRLESDRARALLDSERSRLELARKEFEFQKQQAKSQEQAKADQDEAKRRIDALEKQPPKGVLPILKDYQLAISAIIVAILAIVGLIVAFKLAGGALKTGLSAMAEGIKSAGSGMAVALTPKVEVNSSSNEAERGSLTAEHTDSIEPGPVDASWVSGQPEFEDYISKVQEKIEILSRERNFNFTRQFVDLADDETKIPIAAAVLLALPNEAAQFLLQDISPAQIRRIQGFLETDGGLAQAKSLRRQALQEFYGRIAIDEFTASPLMRLRDLGWLTRMGSEQMAEFAAKLSREHRSAFLACLSPSRAKKLLAAAKNPDIKQTLLEALAGLDKVTPDVVMKFISDIKSSPEIAKQASAATGAVVDRVQYLAAVVDDLEPEEQALLNRTISGDPELQERLKRFFLPFEAVLKMPKEFLTEMLQSRQNDQVAMLLFDASADIRSHVIAGLPGIRAEAVKDELKLLDATPLYAAKNRKSSRRLQKEISKYMLKLVNDGVLNLGSPPASTTATQVATDATTPTVGAA